MNSKKTTSVVLALLLVFFIVHSAITADNSSKSINGTVVCVDKEGKECPNSPSCSHDCCDKCDKPCNKKYGLKTSDGKIYPFAAKSKDNKALNLKDYLGKEVKVNGYICPVSKTVQCYSLKAEDSKEVEPVGCCP